MRIGSATRARWRRLGALSVVALSGAVGVSACGDVEKVPRGAFRVGEPMPTPPDESLAAGEDILIDTARATAVPQGDGGVGDAGLDAGVVADAGVEMDAAT